MQLRDSQRVIDRLGRVASFRKLTPRWRNTWAVKYGAGILPTGQNLEQRGHSTTSACPWCNEEIETTNHIFQCTHIEMEKGYEDELDQIDDFYARRQVTR